MEAKNAELLQAYTELQFAQSERIRLSRIDEELAVARRIQELFLPRKLPQPHGWQLDAFSRGAQAIGGNFFDCIELPAGERIRRRCAPGRRYDSADFQRQT
jgi:serine phosphatase RsbU (regulator of sigma subunit)